MRTLNADFNARTSDRAAIVLGHDAERKMIRVGMKVRLTDDSIEVEAVVVQRDGLLVAIPEWGTLDYLN